MPFTNSSLVNSHCVAALNLQARISTVNDSGFSCSSSRNFITPSTVILSSSCGSERYNTDEHCCGVTSSITLSTAILSSSCGSNKIQHRWTLLRCYQLHHTIHHHLVFLVEIWKVKDTTHMNVAVLPAVLPASSHHPPSSCLPHGDLKSERHNTYERCCVTSCVTSFITPSTIILSSSWRSERYNTDYECGCRVTSLFTSSTVILLSSVLCQCHLKNKKTDECCWGVTCFITPSTSSCLPWGDLKNKRCNTDEICCSVTSFIAPATSSCLPHHAHGELKCERYNTECCCSVTSFITPSTINFSSSWGCETERHNTHCSDLCLTLVWQTKIRKNRINAFTVTVSNYIVPDVHAMMHGLQHDPPPPPTPLLMTWNLVCFPGLRGRFLKTES